MSREEVFRATGPTSSAVIDVKIGAKKDGRITAAEAELRYPGRRLPRLAGRAGRHVGLRLLRPGERARPSATTSSATGRRSPPTARRVRRWRPSRSRACIDELARKLGIDPIELRLKNAAKEGTKASYGPTFGPHRPDRDAGGRARRIRTTRRRSAQPGPRHRLRLLVQFRRPDLRVAERQRRRHRGARRRHARHRRLARLDGHDGGRGARHPATRRCAPIVADTSSIGFNDSPTAAASPSPTGMAMIQAARDAIEQAVRPRREDLGHPAGGGRVGEGLRQAGRRQCRQLRAAVAGRDRQDGGHTGGPIAGQCEVNAEGAGVSFATHICDVEVDPETGHVKILRYTVDPGCRQGDPSELCRGPVPGRRRPGHRLGAQRGIHLRQGRPAAESGLPRLPHPGRLGPADDRHGHRRGAEPGPSLWRARRRRDLDRAAAGGGRQRGLRRGRRAPDATADVAAARAEGDREQRPK